MFCCRLPAVTPGSSQTSARIPLRSSLSWTLWGKTSTTNCPSGRVRTEPARRWTWPVFSMPTRVSTRRLTPYRSAHGPDVHSSPARGESTLRPLAFVTSSTHRWAWAAVRSRRPSSSSILRRSGSRAQSVARPWSASRSASTFSRHDGEGVTEVLGASAWVKVQSSLLVALVMLPVRIRRVLLPPAARLLAAPGAGLALGEHIGGHVRLVRRVPDVVPAVAVEGARHELEEPGGAGVGVIGLRVEAGLTPGNPHHLVAVGAVS